MFQIKQKLFAFLIIFLFQINAYADSPTESLTQLLANIQTFRADFTQTITDKNAKQVQHSVGHMALQRPGKFRWEVTKPIAQLVVTNGARLWIYDPDLEQVTIRLLTKEVGDSPAMLLSNTNTALEKDFLIKGINSTSSALQWFLLTPKNKNSMFAQIKFGFMKNQIREMVLQDHLGHTTAVEFYNINVNPRLSSSLFSFKPPSKVDIIDETRS